MPDLFVHTQPVVSTEPSRELEQVSQAMHPRRIGPLLEQAFGPAGQPRLCRVVDMKYEPGDYCTFLYEWGDEMVSGLMRWSGPPETLPASARYIEPLGMWVSLFPDEPALPGLAGTLDTHKLLAAFQDGLAESRQGRLRPVRCRVKVLRFRPGKRCTVRIDLDVREEASGRLSTRVFYGKIYHRIDKARSVFAEMQMLSNSQPAKSGQVRLAEALGLFDDLSLVLQGPVEGTPLDLLLDCRARRFEARTAVGLLKAGEALAALHHAGLSAGRERPIASELERFQHRAGKIGLVNGRLGDRIAAEAQSLAMWLDRLPEWGAQAALVHGDCKPSQFLVGGSSAALLDFDHVGAADPAGDVGTFLATLRQMGLREGFDRRSGRDDCYNRYFELEKLFLDGYCAAGKEPGDFRYRATWYEAVGLLRKAIRAFERSPYSPLPMTLVAEAEQCAAGLPGYPAEYRHPVGFMR